MNIVVKGKNLKENAALEEFSLKKAEKFYHFYPEIVNVEIELRSEIGRKGKEADFICDINVKVPGHTFKMSDQERDMYKAIDKAVKRMSEVLRREKSKHHGRLKRLRYSLRDLGFNAILRLTTKRIFRRQ